MQFSCVCKSWMERTRPALNNRTKYCAKPSIVKHCQILSSTNQKQQVYYQISDQPGEQKQNDHHDMIWIVSVSTIIISCTFNMTRVVLMVRKVVSLVSMVCMTLDLKVRSWLYWKSTLWKVDIMKGYQMTVDFIERVVLLCWSPTPTLVFIAATFNDEDD